MIEALSIPPEDMEEFGGIGEEFQKQVQRWLDVLTQFMRAEKKGNVIVELCLEYGDQLKISKPGIYRKLKAYKAKGWRGLVDAARVPAYSKRKQKIPGLPRKFKEFWKVKISGFQRKTAPAYRSLFLDDLQGGKHIPGYGTWRDIYRAENPGASLPQACPYNPYKYIPAGWSYANLAKHGLTSYQLAAVRIGTSAAAEFLPSMPGTRVGLPPFSVIQIDDVFHDVKVKLPGNRYPQICVEIGALDLLTGYYGPYFVKAVRERDDKTKEHLKATVMRYLIANIVCVRGFNPQGLMFVGEHGTASIAPDVLETLERHAPGLIRFEAGGIQNTPIYNGLYRGVSKGNPRIKAALESTHGLRKNELSGVAGQKGADPEHAPEDFKSKEREHKWLMTAAHALMKDQPDIIDRLQSMFPSYHDYMKVVHRVYAHVNNREHHRLEGWDECGFTKEQWRILPKDPFQPMHRLLELPAAEQDSITALIHAKPEERHRRVFMSPREAHEYCRETTQVTKIPEFCIAQLLGPDLAQQVTVGKTAEFEIQHPETPDTTVNATALVETPEGHEVMIPRGSDITTFFNPFSPDYVYVYRGNFSYVGRAMVLHKANRLDEEQELRNMKLRAKVISHEAQGMAPVGRKRLKAMQARITNNAKVLHGRDPVEELAEANEYQRSLQPGRVTDEDVAAATSITRDSDDIDSDMSPEEIAQYM